MIRRRRITHLLMLLASSLSIIACSADKPQEWATPASIASPRITPTISLAKPTVTAEVPPPTPTVCLVQVHAPDIRTGIPSLDIVIDAFLSGDVKAREALLRYTSFPCTSEMGLGGPPKCWDAGVPDGTPVEYLPMMGPGEGMPVLRQEIESQPELWLGDEVAGLYGAYRVPVDDYEDSGWPAGEYGIAFLSEDGQSMVQLRIEEGWIVRYDSGFPPDLCTGDRANWVLPPPDGLN